MSKNVNLKQLMKKYSDCHFYVGFSGGADSTFLLCELLEMKKKLQDLNITAVHFDHGLRDRAKHDAQWCQNFCQKHGVDFKLITLDIPQKLQNNRNIEAVCRERRLACYQTFADYKNAVVLLGHHQDDRNETMLIRVLRGGNVSSITSLRAEQNIGEVLFLRPLLDLKRSEIVKRLSEKYKITDFCYDESNDDEKFLRNFLRKSFFRKLFKMFPHSQKGIEHSLKYLTNDALFIEGIAEAEFKNIISSDEKGQKFLMVNKFLLLHDAVAFRILNLFLLQQTSHLVHCDYKLFLRTMKLLRNYGNSCNEAKLISLKSRFVDKREEKFFLQLHNNSLKIIENTNKLNILTSESIKLNWRGGLVKYFNGFGKFQIECYSTNDLDNFVKIKKRAYKNNDKNVVYFDAEKLPNVLYLRHWQHGDNIIPFGSKSQKKLKKIFSDLKLFKSDRYKVPILTAENSDNRNVLWAVGCKVSSAYAIDDTTLKIVTIKFIKAE
ncbi:tRNA lysidine(34) synthetase TilS [Lentisphaerota bacterium WC36G]|nr:tRNA lysidine(34) synthetase TilS [Lentisphaerae bacterium WC36]